MPATGYRETVRAAREISRVDFLRAEIFDLAEPELREIASQRGGIEEKPEWFTGASDPLGERIKCELLTGLQERSFHGEVKNDAARGGQAGNEPDGGVKCGPSEIGRDAKPGEECRRSPTESGLLQPSVERMRLKVNSSESHSLRNLDTSFTEAPAFPFLCGRMIDFEDVESGGSPRIAIGESIKPRAEHDILANSTLDGVRELIFSIAAAHGDECSQGAREGLGGCGRRFGFVTGDRDGERIVEHTGIVEDLVGRAAHGHTLGSTAGLSVLHG